MKKLVLVLSGLILIGFSINAQIADKAEDISPLLIGEKIPDVVLKAADASDHSMLSILSHKPTVIIVYRGGWCPFCNRQLADIQGVESQIIELGYQIVAISPDSPENLQLSEEKNKLDYSLYSDGDGTIAKALGIAFTAPDRNIEKLFKYSDGMNEGFLPVPSVFVVNTSGLIEFEYINPKYRTRLGSDLLLAVLKVLQNKEQ